MEILFITASLALFSVFWFYQNTEVTSKKLQVTGGLTRPLTDLECDYMETLPLTGVNVLTSEKISPAHEALLFMDLVTEEWDKNGESRYISFTDTGFPIGRSMRTSGFD